MSTTSQKLTYLSETKTQLKDMINYGLDTGEKITSETTFRNYVKSLFDAFIKTMTYPDVLYNNLPKVTGEGTSVTLNDTVYAPMRVELSPSALEQETTTGKNIALPTWASRFVTAINNNVFANIQTKDNRNCLYYVPQAGYGSYPTKNLSLGTTFKENTQYTISYDIFKKSSTSRTVFIQYTDGTNTQSSSVSEVDTWEHQTITSAAGKTIDYIAPFYSAGNTFIDINTWQIEEGTTETSYEKPTYGASPNPQYPQEIHTVSGENSVKVENKNLFDGIFRQGNQNNTLVALRIFSNKNDWLINSGDTFTFSTDLDTTIFDYNIYIAQKPFLSSNNTILWNSDYKTNASYTFTTGYTGYLGFTIRRKNETNIIPSDVSSYHFQIEKSSTATTYVEHQEQTYPLSLGNLEYCKIGDYEDEFYLATESDTGLTAGKWYLKKNVGKYILDGTETWSGTTSYYTTKFSNIVGEHSSTIEIIGMSNYFRVYGFNYQQNNQLYFHPNGNLQISNVNNQNYATVNDWKNLLSELQPLLYIPLATPTYTLLSDTLQTQLDNLSKAISYQDQTNVSQTNADLPFVLSLSAIEDLG